MKIPQVILFLLTLITTIHAFTLPEPFSSISESTKELWKRRGGGGGGRGGGGSFSGGRSGGGSGSHESSLTSHTSNTGGRTSGGSGPAPRTYSEGSFYAGGSSTPYRSGSASPDGITPRYYGPTALGFYPGIWLYGAYAYPYHGYYYYHNDTTNKNQSLPMECLCSRYAECGCDSNNATDYVTSVANNKSISRVADVNGRQTLVVNGTLPNGTTAASAGTTYRQTLAEMSGYWVAAGIVVYAVWFIQEDECSIFSCRW